MNFLFKTIILLLSIIIAILIIIPLIIDSKSVQIELQNKLNSKFQTNFYIDSNINISLFPRPKIILKNVSIKDLQTQDGKINIKFDKIFIIPKITSLFKSVKIKEVRFYKTNIEYIISYEINNSLKEKQEIIYTPSINQDFIANKIFQFQHVGNQVFNITNIENIKIINSDLLVTNIGGSKYFHYKNISAKLKSNIDAGKIYAEGSFMSEDVPTIFKIDISTKEDNLSKLTINSPILDTEIYGKFFDSKDLSLTKSNFDGKIKMSISNLKLLLDNYISKENLIFRNINNTENIKITSNIFLNKAILNIENIKIESNSIRGSGNINTDLNLENNIIDAKFNIDHLNFDDMWIGKFKPIKNEYTKNLKLDIIDVFYKKNYQKKLSKLDFTIFGSLLKSDIDIEEFKYKDNLIKNVKISLSSKNSKQIELNNFEMDLDQDSKLKIYGMLENIGSLMKLEGKMEIISKNLQNILGLFSISAKDVKKDSLKDFKLYSDILILPNSTLINNINSVLNNKSLIKGDISINEENDILKTIYNISINDIKIDDYFAKNYINKFVTGNSFLKNLLWLNNIDIDHQLSLKIDRMFLEDSLFLEPIIDINVNRGKISLSSFLTDQNNYDSNLKLYIDVYSPIPTMNLQIKSDKLKFNYDNDLELDKSDNIFNSFLINYFFNLPSFAAFDGDIDIDIENIEINDLKIENFIFNAPLKEGLMKIEKMSANIFGGKLIILGDILLHQRKKINNSFQFLEVSNKEILDTLFDIDNFDSKSNITGIITSYAKNRNEFYHNLNLEAKFISANVTMNKFGMTDFLVRINKNKKSITNPKNIILSKNGKTYFKNINGNIKIKPNNKEREIYISTQSLGLNTITKGMIDLKNNQLNITHNAVLITINSGKAFPIRFAINASGSINDLKLSPNFSQINQYLNIK